MAIGKKALRAKTRSRKARAQNGPAKAMEALDQAMGMSRGQAEAAFRAAVRKVEEIIQVGKRELDVVRNSARDALERLVAAAQRARHTVEAEAPGAKRAAKRGARKSAAGGRRAATKWGTKRGGGKAAKKGKR